MPQAIHEWRGGFPPPAFSVARSAASARHISTRRRACAARSAKRINRRFAAHNKIASRRTCAGLFRRPSEAAAGASPASDAGAEAATKRPAHVRRRWIREEAAGASRENQPRSGFPRLAPCQAAGLGDATGPGETTIPLCRRWAFSHSPTWIVKILHAIAYTNLAIHLCR